MAPPVPYSFDYVLVGGGLGNALTALALFAKAPGARVALVEQQAALGGNHLWCFHAGDVSEAARGYVAPLVGATWERYDVRFPELSRTLEEPYAAVRSERLHQVVSSAFEGQSGSRVFFGRRAMRVTRDQVTLDDGQTLSAPIVIESRGPEAFGALDRAGYQKFVGLELKLRRPSPIQHPVLMDALVPQTDGFRFLYALPFGPDRVLLEDTYFSDDARLDRAAVEAEITRYAAESGFDIERVERREVGILPLPTRIPRSANPAPDGPLVAGYQGAWFHPVTGYSFPIAVRVASALAEADPAHVRERVWPELVREQRTQLRYCLLLNRLFFDAYAPTERRNVIERFYRLPPETVRRFYAMTLTHVDRARILCGRPPRGFSLKRAWSRASEPNASSTIETTPGGSLS